MKCSVLSCEAAGVLKGMCRPHYRRAWEHGTPDGLAAPFEPIAAFWAKVDKCGPVPPHRNELGECWIWLGATMRHGYGKVRRGNRWVAAHRYAFSLDRGRNPDEQVLHECDNPRCVRPSHLSEGSQKKNIADMDARGRRKTNFSAVAKLSFAIAEEIREKSSHGVSRAELAATYGVTKPTINAIVAGRIWKAAAS